MSTKKVSRPQRFPRWFRKTRRGFTLVEIVVVMSIVAIIGGAALTFGVRVYLNQTKVAQARAELQTIKTAMVLYKEEYNELPPNGFKYPHTHFSPAGTPRDFCNFPRQYCYQSTHYGYSEAWKEDILPEIESYLSKKPEKDPWGREYYFDNNYHYSCWDGWSYICSAGPDKILQSIGEGGGPRANFCLKPPEKPKGDDICIFIEDAD